MSEKNTTISLEEGTVVFTPKGDSPSELESSSIGTIVYIVNGIAWVLKDSGFIWIGPLYNLSKYEEV